MPADAPRPRGRRACPLALAAAVLLAAGHALPARAGEAEVDGVRIELAATDKPDPHAFPLRPARLTLTSTEGAALVACVWLQEARGGPTFRYDVTLPPGSEHTLTVHLPATSVQQSYRVWFGPDAPSEGRGDTSAQAATVVIRWPDDWVTDIELLAPDLYTQHLEGLPMWSRSLRRSATLLLGVLTLAVAGAWLLPGRRLVRAAVVLVLAGGAAALVPGVLSVDPPVVVDEVREDDGTEYVLVRCRRRTTWTHPVRGLVPVYVNPWHIRQDKLVMHVGGDLRLPLDPADETHRARLFLRTRPGTDSPANQTSNGSSPSSSPSTSPSSS